MTPFPPDDLAAQAERLLDEVLAGPADEDFDGCSRECRKAGAHTLRWGGCEHAPAPEPTVSISRVCTASDGQRAIGFDTYTVQQLADLMAPALSVAGRTDLALRAAEAILHRNDTTKEAT